MKLDPFAEMGKTFEAWQQMTGDAVTRTAAFYAELDRLEAKNAERAEGAIDEVARLTKETLAYHAQLGAAWRKISLEGMQRAATAFSTSGASAG